MNRILKRQTLLYGAAKYASVLTSLLTTSILSRILTPSEYGVVSAVTVFAAFFAVLADLGLGTAVIQEKSLSREEIDDIFSFSVYVALALGGLFALLGIPLSRFYGDRVYDSVCPLLSLSVFFQALNLIPNAVLMKSKQFGSVGARMVVVSVVTGAAGVCMALAGFRHHALVLQSVLQALLIFLWNYGKTRLRFHARFRKESIRKVRPYSAFQFFYSVLNYFARNLDRLLIGKVLGSESLAYYDKGCRLMMVPVQNLTYVINPVVHPVLSEHQNDKRYIYDSYRKLVTVLSLLGVWITAVCFWSCEELVLLFFGDQWSASVPVFRLLSLSIWPQLISTSAGSIYQSTGNTKLMFRSGVVHFSVTIALTVAGVLTGSLQRVAALVTVSLYLRFLIDYYVLIARNFRYSYPEFLRTFRKDLLPAAVLGLTILLTPALPFANSLLRLLTKTAILSAEYGAMLFLAHRKSRKNREKGVDKGGTS